MPSILLVRHGQGSFGTADYDVLTALGHQQSGDLYSHYRSRSGQDGVVLTAGRLRRQRDTAAPWTADAVYDLQLDERWDEYDTDHILANFADQEISLEVSDGQDQLPPRQFQEILDRALVRWIADPATGDGSWSAFRRRSLDALEDLRMSVGSGQTAIAFTSGGVIATCVAAVLDVPDATIVALNRTAVNTGLTKLLAGRSGLSLLCFNSHEHLHPGRVTFR